MRHNAGAKAGFLGLILFIPALASAQTPGVELRRPATELVQFRAPWSRPAETPVPAATPEPVRQTVPAPDADSGPGSSDYVFAGALAQQLRKIDPSAKVDWDGRTLRIEASGQKFALFQGREMVVNGVGEKTGQSIRIRSGDIYVPQSVVDRIGQELERKATAVSPSPTTTTVAAATPTPPATPLPTAAPVATVLPEEPDATAVAGATPTPRLMAAATPATLLTTPTPAAPAEILQATPETAPTPIPTAPPAPVLTATPFPTATATPKPSPTPVPTATPTPVIEMVTPSARSKRTPKSSRATPTPKSPAVAPLNAVDPVQLALRDKADMSRYNIPTRRKAELESLAANPQIHKVVIHPDDSDFDGISQFGKQGAAICLEIAQRLKTQLQAKGIDSVLTRSGAERVPLGKKLEVINNSGAQVLIIITVGQNAEFTDMGGYRILYVTDSVDYTAVKAGTVEGGDTVPLDLNYRSFQAQNKILGSALLNTMNKAVDRDPVGINPAPLYLGKRAPMASAAVVVGYLTNPADAKRLSDSQSQDRVAGAIVDGITDYASHLRQPAAIR
ncbi:MAG: N-acetylmuramoyl-L-alanine amidase family protein [Candidatus Sumerlaeaceae bacterium]